MMVRYISRAVMCGCCMWYKVSYITKLEKLRPKALAHEQPDLLFILTKRLN